MGGIKTKYSFDLNSEQIECLNEMTEKYAIDDDEGKALQVVLDYSQEEADLDTVFEKICCYHCD